MKKLIIISVILLFVSSFFAFNDSILRPNLFMMKTNGFSALQSNPANISLNHNREVGVGFMNWDFQIYNNSFSIDDYNKYNGEFLDEDLKNEIMGKIDGSLKLNTDFNLNAFAMNTKNFAYSASTKLIMEGSFDKQYIDIVLNGNEYEELYSFGGDDLNFEMIAYSQFEVGYSKFTLQQYLRQDFLDDIPEINVGFSLAALIGAIHLKAQEAEGYLIADDNGFSTRHAIKVKNGIGGFGLKGQIGFSSEVMENLKVGLAFDNIFGYIKWGGDTEVNELEVKADSTFFADMDEELFSQTDSTYTISSYETDIPTEMRISSTYNIKPNWDASFEWKQSFKNSFISTTSPRISIGTDYRYWNFIPIFMKINFGYDKKPYSINYGIGYLGERFSYMFGIQSIGTIIPTTGSKGVGLSSSIELNF